MGKETADSGAAERPASIDDEARQFALLLDGVTDYAIYMLDPDGYIKTWNAGGQRIKGYAAQEVIGTHFSRFYTPQDLADGAPARGLATAKEEGRFTAEGWRLRKDGSMFHASVVIEPIWSEGVLIGYAKITRDTTEQFEAQRRFQVAQEALLQAHKMEAIGKLTLGIAHDFNNLLMVIINSLDFISTRLDDDPKLVRHIQASIRAAERGALLTRQLLTFGKGHNLVAESSDLDELVAEFMLLFRRACAATIDLAFVAAGRPVRVYVDRPQLEAAILNLVCNSRDAMPKSGSITITVGTRVVSHPAVAGGEECEMAFVEVADTGEGIPPDIQHRVFDPFFTTKEIGKGSGLGLSQVFGFASQSGGMAKLDSQPGEGTTIVMYFPLEQASE